MRRAAHRSGPITAAGSPEAWEPRSTRCLVEGVQLGERVTSLQVEIKKSLALACPGVPSPGSQSAPGPFPRSAPRGWP